MFKHKKPNGKIADLVDANIKSVKKSFNKEDMIEYIDISSVNAKYRTLNETTQYIVASAPSRAQQCVQNGDILVSTVRPINRNVAVVNSNLTSLVASTGFCVLRPIDGYREYLLAIVTSDKYTEKMCDIASGGLYPAVNNSDVLSYDIFIPDKDFLHRVTQIYQQADKSKFVGFKSQFIEMFYNEKYPLQKLKTHIDVIRGVSYKPVDIKEETSDSISVILRSNNISNGQINFDDVVYVDNKRVTTEQVLSKGDIVMCGSNGSKKLVGKAAMINTIPSYRTSFGAFCLGIRCKESILPEYLSVYFQTPKYREVIEFLGSGSNILNIKPEHIYNLKIPIPSLEDQKHFVTIAEQADKSKLLHWKSIKYSKYSL